LQGCISVFATPTFTAQKLDAGTSSLLQSNLFEFRGNTYYISDSNINYSKYTLPVKIDSNAPWPVNYYYIWTGTYYMVRSQSVDNVLSMSNIPLPPVYFYDKDFKFVTETKFTGISAIGYLNGTYYCQFGAGGGIVKSTDMENWTSTTDPFPRPIGDATIADNKVAFKGDAILNNINYEDGLKKNFQSTMGDWILQTDKDGDFYLSNDNVYFVKIGRPDGYTASEILYYDVRSIYEYGDDIVIDMGHSAYNISLRLTVPKQDIYDELDAQKSAPYVQVGGNILGFDQPPVIQDGSMLVPMRFLFEQMGASVGWDGATQTVTAQMASQSVGFKIASTDATVNGQTKTMAVPATIIDNQTFVPIRFLSENLGCTVNWDADTRMATIDPPGTASSDASTGTITIQPATTISMLMPDWTKTSLIAMRY